MANLAPAKIAIVSDIHGNLPALEAVIAVFGARKPDLVVNLGDSLSGPLYPLETANLLMRQEWVHLAGNHERQLLSEDMGGMSASDRYARGQLSSHHLHWLESLQPSLAFSESLFFCHGTPNSDQSYLLDDLESGFLKLSDADTIRIRLGHIHHKLVACGHSHYPRSLRTSSGQWLINPGSVGLPAYSDAMPVPHKVEMGSPDARFAWLELSGNNEWRVSLETIPYDHVATSRRALQNERPDWAHALLTGYVLNNAAD